jgi:hypothetical protein
MTNFNRECETFSNVILTDRIVKLSVGSVSASVSVNVCVCVCECVCVCVCVFLDIGCKMSLTLKKLLNLLDIKCVF